MPRPARCLRLVRLAAAAVGVALASACSLMPPLPGGPAQPSRPDAGRPDGARPDAGRPGAARPPAPIADRPINLQGQCAQTEEDGFREQATLQLRDNQVQALSWQLWVGRRGSCRFEMADFRQTKARPHIEMQATDGSACRLMVWQDPRRITLAHASCEKRCTPGIYDQAWPVMFDPVSGRCARP
ncbi:MAG TPA: hypothetical protein PK072_03125 [Quisquiliibacterium sp.]|nr:hypothetical protein [Quisquiliibacterium sp.]HQP65619.1 hypothetical protein [Quisquiliibacterium sp.]